MPWIIVDQNGRILYRSAVADGRFYAECRALDNKGIAHQIITPVFAGDYLKQ